MSKHKLNLDNLLRYELKRIKAKSVRIKRKTNRIIIIYRLNNNSFIKVLAIK
jgi:hypothetical protein